MDRKPISVDKYGSYGDKLRVKLRKRVADKNSTLNTGKIMSSMADQTLIPNAILFSNELSFKNSVIQTNTSEVQIQSIVPTEILLPNYQTMKRQFKPDHTINNFILFWFDPTIDIQNNNNDRLCFARLRNIVYTVIIFNDTDRCIDYLTDIHEEKVLLIANDDYSKDLIPMIHHTSSLDSVYIICKKQFKDENWIKKWIKIKGIFTDFSSVCNAIRKTVKQYYENEISISFWPKNENTSNQLDKSFMYTKILKEILLSIDFGELDIKDYIKPDQLMTFEKANKPQTIDNTKQNYGDYSPLWWYSKDPKFFDNLNSALRNMDINTIVKMGFFLTDLHRSIAQLHNEQFGKNDFQQPFIVYRGQNLSKTGLQNMVNSKNGLVSFNSFLSTSMDRNVSFVFVEGALQNPNMIAVLFVITIDSFHSSFPFADIREFSQFSIEMEVLFSMNTIFRIDNIEKIDNNDRLWQINLTLTNDDDPQLRDLTFRIRKETQGPTGLDRLSLLYIRLGQFKNAKELCEKLLYKQLNYERTIFLYQLLATINFSDGKFKESFRYYEKTLQILQNIFPINNINLAITYNNIGLIYGKMGQYSKAISHHQQSLDIFQKTLPLNNIHFAVCYNYLGEIYNETDEHSKSLEFHKKALNIFQDILSPNHPDIAVCYNYIARLYNNMKNYPNALLYYQKALEIYEKSLSSDHPDFAIYYTNIAMAYENTNDFSTALLFYEKAAVLLQHRHLPNHPCFAEANELVGAAYDKLGQHSKALDYYGKACKIREETRCPDHPDGRLRYCNIGEVIGLHESDRNAYEMPPRTCESHGTYLFYEYVTIASVYSRLGLHEKAFTFYQQTLNIWKKFLPKKYTMLGYYYTKISLTYWYQGKYEEALLYLKKAHNIYHKIVPRDDAKIADLFGNIGLVYECMNNISEALVYYDKALQVYREINVGCYKYIKEICNHIGEVFEEMGEYKRAISYFEQELHCKQRNNEDNYRSQALSYEKIGFIYNKIDKHSKAFLYHYEALKLQLKWYSLEQSQVDLSIDDIDKTDDKNTIAYYSLLASNYNKIGMEYTKIKALTKAILYHEQALNIILTNLPSNHSILIDCYEHLGELHDLMNDYSKSFVYFKKALDAQQQVRSIDYSKIAIYFNKIGCLNYKMGQISEAISYHEKALSILQNNLPQNHEAITVCYNYIGDIYTYSREYSKALSYFENVLNTKKKYLPYDHHEIEIIHYKIGS
ncbi:unnamed protein product, partial [Adineta steineri]